MKEYAVKALRQIEASANKGIWEAHWGCALIAGALLIEENFIGKDAKESVTTLIESLLASNVGFQETAHEDKNSVSLKDFTNGLLTALTPIANQPKALGHDLIYSAYILKALTLFDIAPWESLLDSAMTLIRQIKTADFGWITVNGKNEVRVLDEAEQQTGTGYWTVFCSFDRPMQMEANDMQLGHLLTHGHAIHMLQGCTNQDLLANFDLAYRKRLRGLRLANDDQWEKIALPRRKIDPRTNLYWSFVKSLGHMHGHAFKYAYSFLDLTRNKVCTADIESFGRIVWPNASL